MNIISVSEAKMKLSALVDTVYQTNEEVVITKNGRPVAVLMNPDEYERWRETRRISLDSDLMKEIRSGLKSLKKGNASLYSLEELLPEL